MATLYLLGGFLLALMAAVFIAVLIGSFLSENYQCRVSRSLDHPQHSVWKRLRDIENHASWRKLVKRVAVEEPNRTYRLEHKANPGDTRLTVVNEEAPCILVLRGEDIDGPMSWRWSICIEPRDGGGSNLRIEEEGTAAHPWYRFVLKYISGYEKVITDLAEDLSAACIEPEAVTQND